MGEPSAYRGVSFDILEVCYRPDNQRERRLVHDLGSSFQRLSLLVLLPKSEVMPRAFTRPYAYYPERGAW